MRSDLPDYKKTPEQLRREAYSAFLDALDRADRESPEGGAIEVCRTRFGACFRVNDERNVPIASSLKLVIK